MILSLLSRVLGSTTSHFTNRYALSGRNILKIGLHFFWSLLIFHKDIVLSRIRAVCPADYFSFSFCGGSLQMETAKRPAVFHLVPDCYLLKRVFTEAWDSLMHVTRCW